MLPFDPDSFEREDGETLSVAPPTEEDMAEFKNQVKEWTKIDEQIKKLSIAIRERRIHQRALGTQIQDFMKKHDYDKLETQSGRINSIIRTVPVALKMNDIREQILQYSSQGITGEELVARIFDAERPMIERRSLRRSAPKVSLHLDL